MLSKKELCDVNFVNKYFLCHLAQPINTINLGIIQLSALNLIFGGALVVPGAVVGNHYLAAANESCWLHIIFYASAQVSLA